MVKIILFSFIFCTGINHAYSYEYNFNPECRKAYQEILSLRFKSGKLKLEQEKEDNPDNLIPYFVENYIDFLTIFINENKNEFALLESNKKHRLALLKSGPAESPYFLYSQAEHHLQWAFARLKFGEYITAAWEIRKAYKMLEENEQKFPDFLANKKSLGLIHALIGTIPEKYQWIFNLIGLDGTIEQGMGELIQIINHVDDSDLVFKDETLILYCFLTLYLENDEHNAWEIINSKKISLTDNLLNQFAAANIAMKTGHNDKAISILLTRQKGKEYFKFPYMDYMLGLAKLRRLDEDAITYFNQFLNAFKGLNYIKDAYQKVAWYYLSRRDIEKYYEYIRYCLHEGNEIVDADKQAFIEAKTKEVPHYLLLKSRLLSDGGYYRKAIKILAGYSVDDFINYKHKIEFTYRVGRIYHLWGKVNKSIGYYAATIKNGEEYPFYYAANASLQLGIIFEQKGDFEKARNYYKKCFSMKEHGYKTSINQKAKAGLLRIKDR